MSRVAARLGAARRSDWLAGGRADIFTRSPLASWAVRAPGSNDRRGSLMHGARSTAAAIGLPIATVLLASAIFIADSVTPVTVAVASFYVAVVLLASRFCGRSGVVVVATGCAAATVLSYLIAPEGGDPFRGFVNTVISI